MTSPAIYNDQSLSLPVYWTYYFVGSPPYGPEFNGYKEWKRAIVEKPESVSTPEPSPGCPRMCTGWNRIRRSYNSGGLTMEVHYPWTSSYTIQTGGGAYNASLPPLRPWNWVMRGRTINGALANLKDQKIDLSVAFGERAECAQLFVTNMERVAELYQDLKRSKRGVWDYMRKFRVNPGESRLSQIPKAWLETQFAVKPLVQDVFGAIDKLNQLERDPNAYFFVTKKSAEEHGSGLRSDTGFCYFQGHADKPLVINYDWVERSHTSLVYRLKNPLTRELSNLGITNPFSTAYELMTWSFVLDYAVPVGDYLNLLDADFGWEFLTGSTMLSQKATGKGKYFAVGDGSVTGILRGDASRIQFDNFAMTREVHTSSPWPVYPPLRNPLSSSGRVANVLSLLASVFS